MDFPTMLAMLILLIGSFFVEDETAKSIWQYQVNMSFFAVGLNVIYFFYAQYEGKKFTSCTSCQIGNIIGTAVISLIKLGILMLLSCFII